MAVRRCVALTPKEKEAMSIRLKFRRRYLAEICKDPQLDAFAPGVSRLASGNGQSEMCTGKKRAPRIVFLVLELVSIIVEYVPLGGDFPYRPVVSRRLILRLLGPVSVNDSVLLSDDEHRC